MSSAVLSPHHPSIPLADSSATASSSRPRRSFTKQTRSRASPTAPSTSASASTPANNTTTTTTTTTPRETRSRSRFSTSPDKRAAELRRDSASRIEFGEGDGASETAGTRDDQDVMDDMSLDGGESHTNTAERNGIASHEGEEEIDPNVPEEDGDDNDNDQAPPSRGNKRKSVDADDADGPTLGSEQDTPPAASAEENGTAEEEVNGNAAEVAEPESAKEQAPVEKEPVKRAPRKKRKWLRKGEVDPDDPVAVARQKERHALIDEAILLLDHQIEQVEKGSHESLVWMLDELDRRYKLQMERLEARYHAQMGDLQHIRDQSKHQARSDFRDQRERLANEMSKELKFHEDKVEVEYAMLRSIPDTYPVLRDGRGGGGWQFYPGKMLSTGEEKLVPISPGSSRMRRDILKPLGGIDVDEAKDDLDKMREVAKKESQSQSRSRSPSPRGKSAKTSRSSRSSSRYREADARPPSPDPVVRAPPVDYARPTVLRTAHPWSPPPGWEELYGDAAYRKRQAAQAAQAAQAKRAKQAKQAAKPTSKEIERPPPLSKTPVERPPPVVQEVVRPVVKDTPLYPDERARKEYSSRPVPPVVSVPPVPLARSPVPAVPAVAVSDYGVRPLPYSSPFIKAPYAAAPASASRAGETTSVVPPPKHEPGPESIHEFVTWAELRQYARFDAWGCQLPADPFRRDLVLRESWDHKRGKISRQSLMFVEAPPPPKAAATTATPSPASVASTSASPTLANPVAGPGPSWTSVPPAPRRVTAGSSISQTIAQWDRKERETAGKDKEREMREQRERDVKDREMKIAERFVIPPYKGYRSGHAQA